jgi:uncharacterized protein YegL
MTLEAKIALHMDLNALENIEPRVLNIPGSAILGASGD